MRLNTHTFHYLATLILILTSLLAYSNIIGNDLIGDDKDFILSWPTIKHLSNIPQLFSGDVPEQHVGTYRPLRGVFYMLVYQISGEEVWGYHLFSIIIHTLTTVSVYGLTWQISNRKKLSLTTGLLFSLHPIHTEAITFMTAAFDTPGITMLFGSIYAFIVGQKSKKTWWSKISVGLALGAYLTNEISLAIVPLIIFYLWILNYKKWTKIWKLVKSHIIVTGVYLWLRIYIVNISTRGLYAGGNWYYSYLISLKALFMYIYLNIWPQNLNLVHRLPGGFLTYNYYDQTTSIAQQQSWDEPIIFFIVFIILVSIWLIWRLKQRQPLISLGIGWFLISLLPVLNILPTAVSFSERYAYAASYGFCLLIALVLTSERWNQKKWLQMTLITTILVAYGARTYVRNFDWKDPITYWEKIVSNYPNHIAAQLNLAQEYQINNRPKEAIQRYQIILDIKPDFATSYHRIGQINQYYGDFDQAIKAYDQALQIEPNLGETKYYKSMSHYYLATKLVQENQPKEAVDQLKIALQLNPLDPDIIQLYQSTCESIPSHCEVAPLTR